MCEFRPIPLFKTREVRQQHCGALREQEIGLANVKSGVVDLGRENVHIQLAGNLVRDDVQPDQIERIRIGPERAVKWNDSFLGIVHYSETTVNGGNREVISDCGSAIVVLPATVMESCAATQEDAALIP